MEHASSSQFCSTEQNAAFYGLVNQIRPSFCLLVVGFTIGILTSESAGSPCCATDVKAEFAKLVEEAILQYDFK